MRLGCGWYYASLFLRAEVWYIMYLLHHGYSLSHYSITICMPFLSFRGIGLTLINPIAANSQVDLPGNFLKLESWQNKYEWNGHQHFEAIHSTFSESNVIGSDSVINHFSPTGYGPIEGTGFRFVSELRYYLWMLSRIREEGIIQNKTICWSISYLNVNS